MMNQQKAHIAVVGSGAAGLSAAWLLSKNHRVTLLEKDDRLGGHAHTASVSGATDLKIDTGFIVYNEPSYPNLTRWFDALGVKTESSDMSFAVSRDNGDFEYAGGPLLGLAAQPSVLIKFRFWRMIKDLLRFYRQAPQQIPQDSTQSLGGFLRQNAYGEDFIQDHLLPFGAAIWSTSKAKIEDYPAAAFIRFCSNHGLLQITNRPQWRTVSGGSQQYVRAISDHLGPNSVKTNFDVKSVKRNADQVIIINQDGDELAVDHVVIASHADQALACLEAPSAEEQRLLSAFGYESNMAVLHTDHTVMPKRRRAWCSWNYVEREGSDYNRVCVSYWMNKLQNLDTQTDYFVTLNPETLPDNKQVVRTSYYQHPVFTKETWLAQQSLWSLQGKHRTWFCGSYFGSGFHEDAVQSGLAVAEQLGGLQRPWKLDNPSYRIVVSNDTVVEA